MRTDHDPSSPEPVLRSWGGWDFYEAGGIISTLPPSHFADPFAVLRAGGREPAPWEVERLLNHQHLTTERCVSRDALRSTLDLAAELGEALRHAWPERRFVVACWLANDCVSFYQADEAPKGPLELGESVRLASPMLAGSAKAWIAWCDQCDARHPFDPMEHVDAEFPVVTWGRCRNCGGERVIERREVRFLIGPDIRQDFRVGTYVPRSDT